MPLSELYINMSTSYSELYNKKKTIGIKHSLYRDFGDIVHIFMNGLILGHLVFSLRYRPVLTGPLIAQLYQTELGRDITLPVNLMIGPPEAPKDQLAKPASLSEGRNM